MKKIHFPGSLAPLSLAIEFPRSLAPLSLANGEYRFFSESLASLRLAYDEC